MHLEHETIRYPNIVDHAADAMVFRACGFFTGLVIRFIAPRRGRNVNMSEDPDSTHYPGARSFVVSFDAAAGACADGR